MNQIYNSMQIKGGVDEPIDDSLNDNNEDQNTDNDDVDNKQDPDTDTEDFVNQFPLEPVNSNIFNFFTSVCQPISVVSVMAF